MLFVHPAINVIIYTKFHKICLAITVYIVMVYWDLISSLVQMRTWKPAPIWKQYDDWLWR